MLVLVDLQREHLTKIAQHELPLADKEQEQEYKDRARRLRRALKRLDIEDPFPYRSTRAWWDECAKLASYKERRDLLDSRLGPVVERVEDMRDAHDELPEWGPSGSPNWQSLEARIQELRSEQATARTLDDFQDVGRRAVEIIIGAVNIVYQPWMAGRDSEPKAGDAKARFAQILSAVVPGRSNEELRSVVNAAWRLAQDSKHSANTTRAHALAAAHASMLIARTLAELERMAVASRPPTAVAPPALGGGAPVAPDVEDADTPSSALPPSEWEPPEFDPSEWEPPDLVPPEFEPPEDFWEPPDEPPEGWGHPHV